MKSLIAFFKITALAALTVLLVSCGGGGGSSSGSSAQSVTVKLNISQDNFRSASTSRVSVNGSEIASLLLTVTGNETNISEDILSAVENDGFITLELILNNRYTFGIKASDADDNELCSGSTAMTINSAHRDVTLVCESPDDNNNGGGGDGTIIFTINGVAASGLPLSGGMVYLKDANGTVVTAPIGEDGSYTVSTTGLTAPFILKAVGTVGTAVKTLYAFTDNGGMMNINPYVNLAAAAALGVSDMDAVYEAPSGYRSSMTYQNIAAASESIVRIFADIFAALGVSGSDPLSGSYSADSSGIDGILDYLDIKLTPSGFTVADKSTGDSVISGTVSDLTAETPPSIPADVEALIASYVSITVSQLAEAKAFMEDFYLAFSRGSYEAYLAADFTYNDGYTRDDMTTWTMYTEHYESIENFQIFQRMTTDKLIVYFYTVDTNGSKSPVFYTIEKIAGAWYITGNEEIFTATASLAITRTFGADGTVSYNTGLMLSAAELTELVGVRVINVTGPGLPMDGLNILKSETVSEPFIYNGTGSGNKYYMTSAELAEIQEAFDTDGYAAYTFTAYSDMSQDYTPMGSAIQSITKNVYTSEVPLTNNAEDIDEYFIYASGLDNVVLSAGTPLESVDITYTPQDKTILNGKASYVCEDLTGETFSSATTFSDSGTYLYVPMTPADYSIMKNCVFDLTYSNETLTVISDEYIVASEMDQYNSVSEFVTAVGDIINLTSVLNDNPNDQVTWDLTMPSSVYGVPVTWVVLDTDGMPSSAVNQDGEITRGFPAFGNTYAQITGTMQIGNETINFGPYEIYVLSQDGIEVNANVGLGGLGYFNSKGEYTVYKYAYDPYLSEYNTSLTAMSQSQFLGNASDTDYGASGNFTFYGNYTEDADENALYLMGIYDGKAPDANYDGTETIFDEDINLSMQYTLIPGYILKEGGEFNATILSHAAFEYVRYLVAAKTSPEKIIAALDEYAKAIIASDFTNDGVIDYADVLAYSPYNGTSLNYDHISGLNLSVTELSEMLHSAFTGELTPKTFADYTSNKTTTLATEVWSKYPIVANGSIAAVQRNLLTFDLYNLNDPLNDQMLMINSGFPYGMGAMYMTDDYLIIADDGQGDGTTRAYPISGTNVDTQSPLVMSIYTTTRDIDASNGHYFYEKGNHVDVTTDFENLSFQINTGGLSDAYSINVSGDFKYVFRANDNSIEALGIEQAYAVEDSLNLCSTFGYEAIGSVELYENGGEYYLFYIANGSLFYIKYIPVVGFTAPVELSTGISDFTARFYIDGTSLYIASAFRAVISVFDISDMADGAVLLKQVDPFLPYNQSDDPTWAMAAYNGKVIMNTDKDTLVIDTNSYGNLSIGKHYDTNKYIYAVDVYDNFLHVAADDDGLAVYYMGEDKLTEVYSEDVSNFSFTTLLEIYNGYGVAGSDNAYSQYDAEAINTDTVTWNGDVPYYTGNVSSYVDVDNNAKVMTLDKETGTAYFVTQDYEFKKYDIVNKSVTDTGQTFYPEEMEVFASQYLYMCAESSLEGYDMLNSFNPLDTSGITYDSADALAVIDGYLLVADGNMYMMHAYEIDPTSGALNTYIKVNSPAKLSMLTADQNTGMVYGAGKEGGVYAFQFSADSLSYIGYINTTSVVTDIKVIGDSVYVSSGIGGLDILPKLTGEVYIPYYLGGSQVPPVLP